MRYGQNISIANLLLHIATAMNFNMLIGLKRPFPIYTGHIWKL